jgi:hypothetical protein
MHACQFPYVKSIMLCQSEIAKSPAYQTITPNCVQQGKPHPIFLGMPKDGMNVVVNYASQPRNLWSSGYLTKEFQP